MKNILPILFMLFLFTACQKNIPDDKQVMSEVEKLVLQKEFNKAFQKCKIILDKYPDSPYRMKATLEIDKFYHSKAISGMEENKQLQEAVKYYLKVYQNYPDSSFSAQVLFQAGFILANDLQMYDSAKVIYNKFIDTYPDSKFIEPVKFELYNLGITPDIILKKKSKK